MVNTPFGARLGRLPSNSRLKALLVHRAHRGYSGFVAVFAGGFVGTFAGDAAGFAAGGVGVVFGAAVFAAGAVCVFVFAAEAFGVGVGFAVFRSTRA